MRQLSRKCVRRRSARRDDRFCRLVFCGHKLRTSEHLKAGFQVVGLTWLYPFPPGHELAKVVVAEQGVSCSSDISYHYFSAKLAFPNCCYCCGSTDDLVDATELAGLYQACHTTCVPCRSKGRLPRTRGPKRKCGSSKATQDKRAK